MILNSIELENIRSYEKEKIDFPRGITLFEGDIGSGKSTVLMGIEFALFGLGSQKPESLLSKKASEGSVILEFEVDGKQYTVKRKLRRKGDSVSQDAKESYLIFGGQTEPLSPSELKQRILQILRFNEPSDPRSESRIFRYAVFTPQEEMKQILKETQKRLETIRKAFGVEDYRIITDNAKNLMQRVKESMAGFAVRFERIGEDEQTLGKAKENLREMESVIAKFESEKRLFEEKKTEVGRELDRLKEQERQKETLKSQIEKLSDQIKSKNSMASIFETQIASGQKEMAEIDATLAILKKAQPPTTRNIDDIDAQISTLSEIRDNIRDKKSKMASLNIDIDRLQHELGEFVRLSATNLNDLRRHLDDIRAKKESCESKCGDLEMQGAVLEKEQADIAKMLEDLKSLGAKCPHCENELTAEHKKKVEGERRFRLRDVEEKLGRLRDSISDLRAEIQRLKKEESQQDLQLRQIEKTAPLRDQWIEKTHMVAALNQEIPKLESEFSFMRESSFKALLDEDAISYLRRLRDSKKEYENAVSRMAELESHKEKVSKANRDAHSQIDEIKASVLKLTDDLNSASNRIAQFLGLEDAVLAKSKEQIDLERSLSNTREILAKNRQILENEKNKVAEIEARLLDAKTWKEKHQKFSNYYYWLREFFIPTTDKIEKQVLLSIQQSFNEIYRKWYSVLIDDVTKESRIDEDFTPLVEQDGFVQDVEFLSGGEKTSIALAYRLALNSMMRQESDGLKSNLLILDEPTDGFSKAQLSKVRNLLQELKSQQIILVSHEKELETYVDNIFHITKDSGVSRVMRLGA